MPSLGERLINAAAFTILDGMRDGVAITDESGSILYTNRAMDEMSGYQTGELQGHPISMLGADARINTGIEQDGTWVGEWHGVRKDGVPFTTGVRVSLLVLDGITYRLWLCASEERFRALVDQASDGILITDPAGRYQEVNQAACTMLGYTREELLKLSIPNVIRPQDTKKFIRRRDEFTKTGTSITEWTLLRKDGSEIPVEISAKRLLDGHYQAIVRDLSGRKRVEQELRDLNKTLQTLIEASPLPIVAFALDGNITLWNPAAEQLFGWMAAEVVGKPIPFIPADQVAEHHDMRARDLRGETFAGRIIHRCRKDGVPIDLSVSTAALRDDNGRITGIMSLYTDVTEQLRAKMALEESEERFRAMADTAPVMIWMAGRDRSREWFNKPWLEFRGRSLDQERGSGWTEGVHPDDLAQCLGIYATSFEARRPFQMEYRLRRKDGVHHWVLSSGVPRYSSSGEFLGYIGSCIDINDRKRVEQEREDALEALARTNAELKQFAYVASHDLQEPLRTITAYTQSLSRSLGPLLDDRGRECTEFIVSAARRMSALIQGLLAFSWISDSEQVEMAKVASGDCAKQALENLKQAVEASGAVVEI